MSYVWALCSGLGLRELTSHGSAASACPISSSADTTMTAALSSLALRPRSGPALRCVDAGSPTSPAEDQTRTWVCLGAAAIPALPILFDSSLGSHIPRRPDPCANHLQVVCGVSRKLRRSQRHIHTTMHTYLWAWRLGDEGPTILPLTFRPPVTSMMQMAGSDSGSGLS